MSLRNVRIIFFKELTDILRDRRTLGFMVLLPILVFPALMFVMMKVAEVSEKRLREDPSVIAVLGGEESPSMVRLLGALESLGADPAAFADLGDPLLQSALMQMMTPEETADAMLAASAMDPEKLESARFLTTADFAPSTPAGEELFAGGPPAFLRDGARLRLLRSALALRDRAESDEISDPELLADRQRLRALSEARRQTFDAELAAFEVLRKDVAAGIEARSYHAVLVFHEGFDEALHGDGTASFSVLYDEAQDKSSAARRKVTRFLDRLSDGLVRARIAGHGLDRTLLDPFAGRDVAVGRARSIVAMFLPYIVILMCLAGAIYPAIDLGAGEKERFTLETLLVTPADRMELVLGKFLVITAASLVAAILNIASLAATVNLGIIDVGDLPLGLELDPMAMVLSAVLMLPVAAMFSAALLATSIFAKSFKEAQSYTVPMQFLVIVPAFASMVPGIELTRTLSLVPLVNVSLALKEAWAGIFQWDCLALLVVSSAFYAGAALFFCVRWFQREEVLFRT